MEEKTERQDLIEVYKEKTGDMFLEDDEAFEEFMEDRLGASERARLQNGKEIGKALGVVKDVTETGNIKIDENGIHLKEMDDDHVSMAELTIPPEALEELEIEGMGTMFEIEMQKFIDYFERARADESVTIERKGEEIRLEFLESGKSYKLSARESTGETLPSLGFDGMAEIQISPTKLRSALLDAGAVGNLIKFMHDGEDFKLKVNKQLNESTWSTTVEATDETFKMTFPDGEYETMIANDVWSQYKKEYIKNGLTTSLGDVTLKWGTETPIQMDYSFFEDLAHLTVVVAPRVEGV